LRENPLKTTKFEIAERTPASTVETDDNRPAIQQCFESDDMPMRVGQGKVRGDISFS